MIAIAEFVGFRPLSEVVEQKYTIKGFFPIAFTGYRGHLAGLFCIMVGLSIFLILKTNFTHIKDGQVSYSNYSKIIHSNHYRPIYTYTNLVITSTCIFLISNTSAIIGAVSAFVMALLILKRRLNIVTLAINLILIMSSIQIVKSFGDYAMKSGWVSHTATSEDLSTTSTLETRLILWESAINLFKQRPILGWGQNTYENLWYTSISKNKGDKLLLLELGLDDNIVFSRINDSIAYKDSDGITKPQRLIYSSSHNAYLDLLYSSGLIGLASVILLSFYIVKKLKYPLPSIAFSISYLAYLAAWFPVSTNLLPFVCLIGIMLSESQREL
ncbi:O-antigen ligase family protein [Deinococcus sp. 12RED42]|uniref:O-antigen ligase family protein n=1 Tax=Deinococcus sp. 12RED42 TaxID=2745872 RepID=UPI001E4A5AC2|nr:O-antigen ligase family protein [Deinococcus sp. 12RED42]